MKMPRLERFQLLKSVAYEELVCGELSPFYARPEWAHPRWCTSSSKALPLKDCVTCPKSVTNWGPSMQIEEPKDISYSSTIGIYHLFAWCTHVCMQHVCSEDILWESVLLLFGSQTLSSDHQVWRKAILLTRFSLFTVSLDCELTQGLCYTYLYCCA